MIERPVAVGRGGAGEIERAQPVRRDRRADDLHHIRIGALLVLDDFGGQRRDIDRRIVQQSDRGTQIVGRIERRQIALHVHHHPDFSVRIGDLQRLEDAVGAGGMVGAGHQRAGAGLFDRGQDRFGIGRHDHLAEVRRLGAPDHMLDHRLAGDVGQRLAGQPGGRHAGRDQDQDVAVWH